MIDRAEALESELVARAGFVHAFFTRRGGVSRAPFASLNFAASVGDDPACVAENLRRAADVLGISPSLIYFASQVHGTRSLVIAESDSRDAVLRTEADAIVSSAPGVACAVRSADCVPVLVGDRRSGAALAIHSGWRGTTLDVVGAALAALRQTIGDAGDLVAAIGPHIETCCFEVGEDVAAELARASSLGERAVSERGERPHVDLRAIVRAQLEARGLTGDAIDDVRGCTVCDPERFHSYRRDGKVSGRLLSAIRPR